jgi:hypothetical protein
MIVWKQVASVFCVSTMRGASRLTFSSFMASVPENYHQHIGRLLIDVSCRIRQADAEAKQPERSCHEKLSKYGAKSTASDHAFRFIGNSSRQY